MKPTVALIGPGKVGCAVAHRLHGAGYPIAAVIGRDLNRSLDGCRFIGCSEEVASVDLTRATGAEIILLAVPDDQIANLAKNISAQPQSLAEKTLIHFSGRHAAEVMRTDNNRGSYLSIHPLLPFANRQLASNRLTNCPCALEGDDLSIPLGIELIEAFSGQPFRIESEKKALYHTSACIASNFLVTLQSIAAKLLTECGVEIDQAIPLLLPLVKATLDNIEQLGPEQGLTGPIVRGDCGTVAAHISALEKLPDLLPLYQLLGAETIDLAKESSRLSQGQADRLIQLIYAKDIDSI